MAYELTAQRRRFVAALAERRFGSGQWQELSRWATEPLETYDAPSLRMLAGATQAWGEFEIDQFLERAARELDVQLPEPEELPEAYARLVAEDIVEGRVPPLEGCRTLFVLSQKLQYPSFLNRWTGLDDAVSLARDDVHGTIPEVEEQIVCEAKRLLGI